MKSQAFFPHKETQHVAMRAAAKAVEALRAGKYDERWLAIFMEGTVSTVVFAAGTKRNVMAYEILDSHQGFEPLDLVVRGGPHSRLGRNGLFPSFRLRNKLRCL